MRAFLLPNVFNAETAAAVASPAGEEPPCFIFANMDAGAGLSFTRYLVFASIASCKPILVLPNEIGGFKNAVLFLNIVSVGLFALPPNAPPI